MKIVSKFKDYYVNVEKELKIIPTLAKENNAFFVIDQNVYNLYKRIFDCLPLDRLVLLDAVETKKTVETALDICEKMTVMPSKRNTHLVSIGGGITQDVTGFVANVLYRGIKWTFFPSTLLAACDSCIGGKTSLNYKGFKNLLGTFYPPDEIIIYPHFFETLTEKDYKSGLGEVVKFNVMSGANGIDKIKNDMPALLSRESTIISKYIDYSLNFKKSFIEEDEFDKGKRILLNFAHTFGHAFEVSSNYDVPHGTAVVMGMIVANRISVKRGLLDESFANSIESVCVQLLPSIYKKEWFDLNTIIKAIRKDKKQVSTSIRAVLMKSDLSLEIFNDVLEDEIKESIEYFINSYSKF